MLNDATRVVRIESLRVVYRQLPLTLGASVVNALVTGAVLAPRAGWKPVAVWLAAFALMAALRTIAWRQFVRLPEAEIAEPLWSRIAIAGALASGMLWGACALFLVPAEGSYPLFIAFVVGGMCAGTVTVNAAHLASVAAFLLPAVLPLAAWFICRGDALALPMALMTTLFAGALILAAWRYAKEFSVTVQARAALAERTAELAEANARLRAEIGERESAEAALRQSQKMEAIGNLTAGVAHEVNNVLTVVRGAAEVLRRRLTHAPGHLRQIAAILRATQRGSDLTRRLLAFARQETLNPETIDLNAVMRGIAGLLGVTLGRTVQIALDLDETLPAVFVDRSGLEHAVVNLAINARDAMPGGGTLTFRTTLARCMEGEAGELPAGTYALLAVVDSGLGMTEAVRARAFDPFFTTKPPGQGSGLGLSQVYGLLRQSGGAVRIESAPGQGTTMLLYLPLADTAQRPLPATLPEPPHAPATEDETASRHIVLLEDEDMVREVVAELLESAGYRVSAFARAADALRRVETDPSVSLLLTDLGLPDSAGDEVAQQAQQVHPNLPVLFITGSHSPKRLAGEAWLLRKPFAEAELLAMVADALRKQ